MGSNMSTETFHAKRNKMINDMTKGKQLATQLKALIANPSQHSLPGFALAHDLSHQILTTFTDSLSELAPSGTESPQISAVDHGHSADTKKEKKLGVRDRRGCYKRRRAFDSKVVKSETIQDGHAWRKYGQKIILNSEYPRCYYRCTHKNDQNCKAIRQVQMIENNPASYQITYFNDHSCTSGAPHPILGSDPVESNLICFQTKSEDNHHSPIISIKEDETKSSSSTVVVQQDPWQDLYKPDLSTYQDHSVGFHSFEESTNFHYCGDDDGEVDQIGEIDMDYFLP